MKNFLVIACNIGPNEIYAENAMTTILFSVF